MRRTKKIRKHSYSWRGQKNSVSKHGDYVLIHNSPLRSSVENTNDTILNQNAAI